MKKSNLCGEGVFDFQRLTIPIEGSNLTIISGSLLYDCCIGEGPDFTQTFCWKEPTIKKLIKAPIISVNVSSGEAYRLLWKVKSSKVKWDSESKIMTGEVEITGTTGGILAGFVFQVFVYHK